MALVELSAGKLKLWTSLLGSESKAAGTKQLAGGLVALEMKKLVRLYRDYQPAMLVAQLNRMSVAAPEIVSEAGGAWRLDAAAGEANLQIVLDRDATQVRVVQAPAVGQASRLEILYADYTGIEKAWYPKSITIRFDDQLQHGLELQFRQIEFVAS
jgi:hypothetical protein